jgi:tripartite-type tricarboxylate transporter receptor subunit TctC
MQRTLLIALTLLVGLAQSITSAETYPSRPIRLLVGFTPGGAADVSARVISRKMSESLGVNIVVENRSGAGGNIAAAIVATANPDGYTLFWGSVGPLTVSPALGVKLPYDPLTDFAPIGLAVHLCNILAARSGLPANSVAELIALAKAKPGQLNYATQGIASTGHLAGELLKSLTGIDIVQVAYKGGSESITALLGGEIELAFLSVAGIRSIGPGRIKPIAVTCAKRDTALSSVPTFAESGVASYDATFWYGLLAPARTPSAVIEKLNRQMTAALTDTTVTQQLEAQGLLAAPSSAEKFHSTIRDDYAKWKKVLSAK